MNNGPCSPGFRFARCGLAKRPRVLALLATILASAGLGLDAQELTVLGGAMDTTNLEHSSYSWQIDYRQEFYRNFAASIAYINEGHVPGHHRDGTAVEVWGRLPFVQNHFSISLGLGAYLYYDTQLQSNGDTANVHGSAPIFSASATGYFSNRWLYRIMFNHISPPHEMKVDTAVLGLGYWFGQGLKPVPGFLGDAPDEPAFMPRNELTIFVGQSVVNTFFDESARAYAVEYRRSIFRHIDWTASLIYEGNPEIARRSGAALQAWAVNSFFDDRVSVGIGLGPYIYIDRKHPEKAGHINPAAVAPLGSLTISGRLTEHWISRLVFNRVTSSYNRDADIFLLGLGYRWPAQAGTRASN